MRKIIAKQELTGAGQVGALLFILGPLLFMLSVLWYVNEAASTSHIPALLGGAFALASLVGAVLVLTGRTFTVTMVETPEA